MNKYVNAKVIAESILIHELERGLDTDDLVSSWLANYSNENVDPELLKDILESMICDVIQWIQNRRTVTSTKKEGN